MIPFVKGHGTGNDFVIIEDVDGSRALTSRQVAALCDRHTGIGGDGLLRVVRAAKHPDSVDQAGEAEWFMDYYNADGSIAEMCGNGVRVFARYLREHHLDEGTSIPVATRAGLRTVTVEADQFHVDMGLPRFGGASEAVINGQTLTGTVVSMGNPHLVCRVDDVGDFDLTRPPQVSEAVFPNGVNVELITGGSTAVRMRVHERGVGETLSCGTGACAAAAVALGGTGVCTVDVPGGRLTVTITDQALTLGGPAVLVAAGHTDLV